jgi:PAS domain-containing protein
VAALLVSIYLAAAFIAAVVAVVIARRRSVPGGRWLVLLMAAAAFWALCDAVELAAGTPVGRRRVSQVQYLGVVMAAPAFLEAALALARRPPSRLLRWAIWTVPLLTLPIAWTSAWHGWLWTSIELTGGVGEPAIYRYGPWFWLLTAQNYALLLAGTVAIAVAAGQVRRPFRGPLWVLVAAVCLPWAGHAAYAFKLGPWVGLNWASVSLIAMGTILGWAVWGEGLLDVLPRTREALLEGIADGVIQLGPDGSLRSANPAARRIVGTGSEGEISPYLLEFLRQAGASGGRGREVRVPGDTPRWLEVRSDSVADRWGEPAGDLVLIHDITERKLLEAEREELIAELQKALAEVRSLEELLPVCARCKKVRDDGGYWDQLDRYLKRRARVRFSHGICPECAEDLYGHLHLPEGEAGTGEG